MAEFLLKPNEFQKQVDSFKAATDTVTTLKYELEKEGVSLNSIDKYAECVAAMNELIMSFLLSYLMLLQYHQLTLLQQQMKDVIH